MVIDDTTYIIGVWNGIIRPGKGLEILQPLLRIYGGKWVEQLITAYRNAEGKPKLELRLRVVVDDKVFDGKDEKFFFGGALPEHIQTDEDVIKWMDATGTEELADVHSVIVRGSGIGAFEDAVIADKLNNPDKCFVHMKHLKLDGTRA